ncbi:MAG: DUF333 domain-containing protein [Bdellovibrionales bacterium]|nr:DUF333 domain-containing protein [Bdellovibrionales bacterium]
MLNKFLAVTLLFVAQSTFATGGGSSVGPANPAAVACVDLGGALEPFETPAGAAANCVIEEWTLFKAMKDAGLAQFVPHDMSGPIGGANPAAVNCINIGGELRSVQTRQGTAGYCVIEEWTLYRVFHP